MMAAPGLPPAMWLPPPLQPPPHVLHLMQQQQYQGAMMAQQQMYPPPQGPPPQMQQPQMVGPQRPQSVPVAAAVVSAAPTVRQYQRAERDAALTSFVPASVKRAVAKGTGGAPPHPGGGGATTALVAAQQARQKEQAGRGSRGEGDYDAFLDDMKTLGAL